jgi:6,7-dimethyl-8-ribityllumazine synthase
MAREVPGSSPSTGPVLEGSLDARGKRFAIVAARFNESIVERLITGAVEMLVRLGARAEDVTLCRVPGSFEVPPVARRLAGSGSFDAVVCLGAVIRGATPHFDYVAGESARGVARAAQKAKIPVVFGILTTDTVEQAMDRAGVKSGNKGADAAMAAVEMANLYQLLGVVPPRRGAFPPRSPQGEARGGGGAKGRQPRRRRSRK